MTEAAATLHDVERAISWFETASKGHSVLFHVIAGLSVLRDRAACDPGMVETAAVRVLRFERALLALAPVLAADTEGLVPAEEIYAGLGCVAALVTHPDVCARLDQILYVGLLAGKLSVIMHERALAARGDAVNGAIAIWRASYAPPATHLVQ